MAKLNHTPVAYPQVVQEYHVVTPYGKTVYITNDPELAKKHAGIKLGFKVIVVTTIKHELAVFETKSDIIKKIAEQRGIPVIDIPLSVAA
jgi:hypothetical protein